jgi:hypothetical protein
MNRELADAFKIMDLAERQLVLLKNELVSNTDELKSLNKRIFAHAKDIYRRAIYEEFEKVNTEVPNETTIEAMKEADNGDGFRYESLEELIKDWDSVAGDGLDDLDEECF